MVVGFMNVYWFKVFFYFLFFRLLYFPYMSTFQAFYSYKSLLGCLASANLFSWDKQAVVVCVGIAVWAVHLFKINLYLNLACYDQKCNPPQNIAFVIPEFYQHQNANNEK